MLSISIYYTIINAIQFLWQGIIHLYSLSVESIREIHISVHYVWHEENMNVKSVSSSYSCVKCTLEYSMCDKLHASAWSGYSYLSASYCFRPLATCYCYVVVSSNNCYQAIILNISISITTHSLIVLWLKKGKNLKSKLNMTLPNGNTFVLSSSLCVTYTVQQ